MMNLMLLASLITPINTCERVYMSRTEDIFFNETYEFLNIRDKYYYKLGFFQPYKVISSIYIDTISYNLPIDEFDNAILFECFKNGYPVEMYQYQIEQYEYNFATFLNNFNYINFDMINFYFTANGRYGDEERALSSVVVNYSVENEISRVREEGYQDGLTEGYQDGYIEGKKDGYDVGFTEGSTFGGTGFSLEWLTALFDTLNGFLSIEIFPFFKLWYVIGIPLIFGVIRFVLGWFV